MEKKELKEYIQDKMIHYVKSASLEIDDDIFLTQEEKKIQQTEYEKQFKRIEKIFGY